MGETAASELIGRYRANYGLAAEAPLTEEMVLAHWELERRLTEELMESTPQTRTGTFERCYTELYQAVPWLREGSGVDTARRHAEHALWTALIGPPPLAVYEIGSGAGSLIRHLARAGYRARASEITSERGDRGELHGLTWGRTDGVHLDAFESPGSFDVVISDQVIEHLHPDDLSTHLRSAAVLLKPGGRLIFATPHAFTGPHDLSRVFELDAPAGMHLCEYTNAQLRSALHAAGYACVAAPMRLPVGIRARLRGFPGPRASRAYLRYLILLESLIGWLPPRHRRRLAEKLRVALFTSNIMLVASRA